jgi:hypothetical protein
LATIDSEAKKLGCPSIMMGYPKKFDIGQRKGKIVVRMEGASLLPMNFPLTAMFTKRKNPKKPRSRHHSVIFKRGLTLLCKVYYNMLSNCSNLRREENGSGN